MCGRCTLAYAPGLYRSTVVHFISRHSLLFDIIIYFVQPSSLRSSSLPSIGQTCDIFQVTERFVEHCVWRPFKFLSKAVFLLMLTPLTPRIANNIGAYTFVMLRRILRPLHCIKLPNTSMTPGNQ